MENTQFFQNEFASVPAAVTAITAAPCLVCELDEVLCYL